MAHSMDGEEDWIWGGEGPSYVDVQEIRAQLAFNGSLQALREIRSVVFGVSWGFPSPPPPLLTQECFPLFVLDQISRDTVYEFRGQDTDTSVNRRRIYIVDMKLPSLYREFIENGDIFCSNP